MSKLTLRCWLHLLSTLQEIRVLILDGAAGQLPQPCFNKHYDHGRNLDDEHAEIEEALNDAIHAE